jgi:hypothetical protein
VKIFYFLSFSCLLSCLAVGENADSSYGDKYSERTTGSRKEVPAKLSVDSRGRESPDKSPFVLFLEIGNGIVRELDHLFAWKIPNMKKDSKYEGTTNQLHAFRPVMQNLQNIGSK